MDLYYRLERAARPYGVGVVLDRDGTVWAEVLVRFNFDWAPPAEPGEQVHPAVRPWLVTSGRVVGRLANERLHGYRRENAVGVRVDLRTGPGSRHQ